MWLEYECAREGNCVFRARLLMQRLGEHDRTDPFAELMIMVRSEKKDSDQPTA